MKTGAILGMLMFLFLAACESMPVTTRHELDEQQAASPAPPPYLAPNPGTQLPDATAPQKENAASTPTPTPEPLPMAGNKPRLALILGPGGLRAYAHAGLLQELAKAKIPVFFVGGLEMGALPAALFALKGQPFEPEWQMMKLKEEDLIHKGLLSGSSPLKTDTLTGPLQMMFGGAKVEDAKIPSMCPSYSIAKRQTFLMNRGTFVQMLPFCLPAWPLFEPHQGSGANPLALMQMAQAARQKGAQLVVYVDLLTDSPALETDTRMQWGLFQQALEAQNRSVNEVVRIGGLAGLRSFDRRHEMVQKGQEAGRKLVQTLQTKYGF